MTRFQKLTAVLCTLIAVAIIFTGCTGGKNDAKQEIEADYSAYFKGTEGTAVFYNANQQQYHIFNKDLAEKPSSPCSSFKIISCLMGLESGAINPSDSTLKWDGANYPMDIWNMDLDYKQAFKTSAIWYFRDVIDKVGEDYVKNTLDKLNYGNCDISQWEGSLNNILFPDQKDWKQMNGFWQESSLEISPRQQVDVMKRIFEDKDVFSQDNLDLMKEAMLIDKADSSIKIYGKTGSGIKDDIWVDAWFVGMFENNGETTYFAIRLNEPDARGPQAKEIAINIINGEFGEAA